VIPAELVGSWSACAWLCELSRQAVSAVIDGAEVLHARRYASPARRSISEYAWCNIPKEYYLIK